MTSAQNPLLQLNGNKALLLLLFLILVLSACGDGKKEDNPPIKVEARVTVSRASVFKVPNRNADVIINLLEGETAPVLGKSPADELGTVFYLVQVGEQTGWVASSQVELHGEATTIAEVFVPADIEPTEVDLPDRIIIITETPAIQGTVVARVSGSNAAVLDYPSTIGQPVGALGQGQELEVESHTVPDENGNKYYGVSINGRLRWVSAQDVEIIGDLNNAQLVAVPTGMPTRLGPASPTAIVQMIPSLPTSTPTQEIEEAGPIPTNTITAQPLPTNTLPPTDIPTIAPSPTPRTITAGEPPPLTILLPEGWEEGHYYIPIDSLFTNAENINLSVYQGALPDGMFGYIWVIWRFPNIYSLTNQSDLLWSDSILYLRQLLFSGCVIGGFDATQRRVYTIGNQMAIGSSFSAVDCEGGASNIAGRFMALIVNEERFAFYLGVEPVDRVLEGLDHLQNILNTVQFTASN